MAADGYEFADWHGAVLAGGAGRYSADWLIHGWQRARSFPPQDPWVRVWHITSRGGDHGRSDRCRRSFVSPILRRRGARHAPRPHPHEMAAAFGFLAIPIVAVTVSMLTTESFTDRYALPAVIGCSLIVAFAAHKSLYGRPATVTILTLFLFGCFLSLGEKSFTTATAIREANAQAIQFLRSKAVSDLPIAVSDQHAFMSLAHYAPRDISSRLVYLADPDKALYHLGHNSVEKGTLALLKPWFHLQIEEYDPFLASGHSFFVYSDSGHFLNWLLPDLIASCRHLELSGQNKASLLFLVTPGKGC